MKRLIPVVLLLFLTSCSLGREIDTSADYSSELQDGTYTASSVYYDSYGYKKNLTLGIHRGIISDVNYKEINHAGEARDEIATSAIPWDKCEYSYLQIKPQLYDQTILTQGERIDTISGATKTCDDYRILLHTALQSAESGVKEEKNVSAFSDTYTARNEVDPLTGSQEEITVEYTDGVLTSIEVRELSNSTSHRALSNLYSSLAEISFRNKSLDNIPESTVDSTILNRYNALLTQIRSTRGE